MGIGDEAESKLDPKIYNSGLVTIGENSVIPSNVKIGKNVAIAGVTEVVDYPNAYLGSGEYIIKAGDVK
jgi:glucose-1-phosphate adenylyltransferase